MNPNRFGAPFVNPIPRSIDLKFVIGDVVEVGPPDENPSREKVEEIFQRYTAALVRVFDAHKDCLPPEVAEKGLRIVHRAPKKKTARL